jgi:hypothetical protein
MIMGATHGESLCAEQRRNVFLCSSVVRTFFKSQVVEALGRAKEAQKLRSENWDAH